MTSDLRSHAQSLQGDTVELRRRIHREPEVGLDLPRTRQAVLDALDGLPLDIHLHTKTSGIVAVLGHELPGPGFVLRGDMDGLPLSEDTGLEFASTGDTMHACGHDLHTAMLASAARLLCERRAQLPGPVVFMFQPGEEGYHGARYMLEEGLLDVVPRPSAGLAIHVTTSQAHGTFNHRSGPMLAAADELHVTITGEGGHASAPHQALDPGSFGL